MPRSGTKVEWQGGRWEVGRQAAAFPHLFFSQTVADIERGWILANKEQHRQLKSLQEKVSKKEVGFHFPLPMQCESVYITLFHSQVAVMKFIHPRLQASL